MVYIALVKVATSPLSVVCGAPSGVWFVARKEPGESATLGVGVSSSILVRMLAFVRTF